MSACMNERDLAFFVRCASDDMRFGQHETYPDEGEAAAAERLRRARLVTRDPTVTIKPYGYVLTDAGFELHKSLVRTLSGEATR